MAPHHHHPNSGVPNSAPAVAALALNLMVRAPERAETRAACVSLACQLLQQLPSSDAHPVLLGVWRLARSGKVCTIDAPLMMIMAVYGR